jgi:hypothetical protein
VRKQLILISDGGDSRSKKCKRDEVGAHGAAWWSMRLAGVWSLASGVWSQAVGFVLVQERGFSRREDVFTFNLLYNEILRMLRF